MTETTTMKRSATFITLLALLAPTLNCAADRPNVLFIAVDDLRPELGCYSAKHIKSPNIDRFADTGMLFERAYCQQAVCNPSRTSVMTGLRPDTTGIVTNHAHFRAKLPNVVTLPQHFKNHGYDARAIGKIYHGVFPDGTSKTTWDTMGDPPSWSSTATRFGPRYYYTESGIAQAKQAYRAMYRPKNSKSDDWTKYLVFGPMTEAPDVADNTLYDGKVADAAIAALRGYKAKPRQPFFLAVGFIKPHTPFVAPKRYYDLYDVESIALAERRSLPTHAPKFAGHGSGEVRRYTDQPKHGPFDDSNQRRLRHGYYACISYIDAQVGRVLDELDRLRLADSTVVVLWGDHGFHLGEQGMWGKTTNFELDTRVPLIVRAPGMKAAGGRTRGLVELLDLYPTLSELASLPVKPSLEGKSFVASLNNPNATGKPAAFSQYPRGDLMGYSMRTSMHRLTRWIHRKTGEVRDTELYDCAAGHVEAKNIANGMPELVARLSAQLETSLLLDSRVGDGPALAGFEGAMPGAFKRLVTPIGTWSPGEGRVLVDDQHAKTGKHCLQLAGGDKSTVTLQVADGVDTSGILTFWAERWTSRKPFSFRIEKQTVQGWQEIYNGDDAVRVGRAFLNHVKIPLSDPGIKRLRFTCTSPPNTGVLIDDIRIAPARPQKIVSVEAEPFTLPALVGTPASPLLKLKVVTTGQLNPISLRRIALKFHGSTEAIDRTGAFVTKADAFRYNTPLGAPLIRNTSPKSNSHDGATNYVSEKFATHLNEGVNTLWVACRIKPGADVDHTVGAAVREVAFSSGQVFKLDGKPAMQKLGVAVRKGGDDGVHTYRIPGLVTTNKGTLIAVYDIRRRSGGDLPGDIDVGMSRSTDGGQSWEPMKVIMDMGHDPAWRYDGIGDPAVLVDQNTGTVWVAATWSHGNRSWHGSGPGLKPEETGQLMLVRSDDDGVTWSKPINITRQVKRPEWSFILQGPGKGITMRDGTIVFAAQYQDPPDKRRLPHSTIIYSKDHGKTWHVGAGAYDDTTEAQVVEIEPGVLMLNCRYNRKSARVVMTTRDMGKTWQRHPTSERALIEPRACMASLIDVERERGRDASGWLLFSNPDSLRGRRRITIKGSPDRGMKWPDAHQVMLDEGLGAGYSCMTMIDDATVGILYEGSQAHMTFQRVPLKQIIAPPREASIDEASHHDRPVARRPNVLLIVSEDNGAELGCYGDPYVRTPNLDKLAAEGARFANAYVTHPVCSASRASFLTGLYPFQNGQIGLATHQYAMFRKWDNLASVLKAHGYRTGLIGKLHVNPASAFPFDEHPIRSNGFNDRPMGKYAEAAAKFMNASDQPFFLSINFPDAHFPLLRQQHGLPKQPLTADDVKPLPFIGADSPRLRQGTADYYNCLMRLDTGVGMVLQALDNAGKADETLVIYIGDHGAQFSRGKATCYEGGLRIPMILRWPGQITAQTVRDELVSTVDLLPTVIQAVSLPSRASLPGRSLLPLAAGQDVKWRRYLFAERTAFHAGSFFPQRVMRDERYKVIVNLTPDRPNPVADQYRQHYNPFFMYGTTSDEIDAAPPHVQRAYRTWRNPPAVELYDLNRDPWEYHNLAADPTLAPVRQRLLSRLQQFRQVNRDPLLNPDNLKLLADEHDRVNETKPRGRYSRDQQWRYLNYLSPTDH